MVNSYTYKFQRLPFYLALCLFILPLLFVPQVRASQDALVVVDKAIIYSDKQMTNAVGFVRRGKKLVVGEVAKNANQVYPIVVSGKVAYIRALDLATKRGPTASKSFVAERFKKATITIPDSKFVFSYYAFDSQISVADKADFFWHGISLKGEVFLTSHWDFQIITNYMIGSESKTTFNTWEFGFGGAFRIVNSSKFILRLEAQALSVPFSTYSYGNDFRLNSYGYSLGAGLNSSFLFDEHWGVELSAGLYQTKIFRFDTPTGFDDISPSFIGSRFGLGLNYIY